MRTRRSTSMLVALLGGALALAGPSVAAAAQGVYGGELRTDDPLVLLTNTAGTKVSAAIIGWDASCTSGQALAYHSGVRAYPKKAGTMRLGALAMTYKSGGRFTATLEDGANLEGRTGSRVTWITITGRLTRTGASGTFRADVSFTDVPWLSPTLPDKVTQLDSCSTGKLSWKAARKPGTVYGGQTAQAEPLVIVRNARGTSVKGFHAGWHATCNPSGFTDMPETFVAFPISGGAFGDTFQQQVVNSTGGTNVFDYDVHGVLTKSSGTGTLQAKATWADGSVCDSGRQAWKAYSG